MDSEKIMGHQKASLVLLVFTVILVIMSMNPKVEAQDCNQLSILSDCYNFLTTGAGQPTQSCCQVVQSLAKGANSRSAKRQTCACIKSEISIVASSIKDSALANLPSQCRANFPFPLSKNMNCNRL